jgi:hypothetical protein
MSYAITDKQIHEAVNYAIRKDKYEEGYNGF